jgi:hypothetical protein
LAQSKTTHINLHPYHHTNHQEQAIIMLMSFSTFEKFATRIRTTRKTVVVCVSMSFPAKKKILHFYEFSGENITGEDDRRRRRCGGDGGEVL